MSDEEFSAARQELQELYISSFSDKIATLKSEQQNLAEKSDVAGFEALKGAVHKLAGSAGSYGFPEIAVLARNIEHEIKAQDASITKIDDLTTLLIAELERHLK